MGEKNFKTLTLNEDHLRLIQNFRITTAFSPVAKEDTEDEDMVGVDKNQMFSGAGLIMDLSTILGVYDQALPHTQEDPDGPRFEPEVEQRLLAAYNYVADNLQFIEMLLHQFATEGLKAGTYRARLDDFLWSKVD